MRHGREREREEKEINWYKKELREREREIKKEGWERKRMLVCRFLILCFLPDASSICDFALLEQLSVVNHFTTPEDFWKKNLFRFSFDF